LTAKRDGRGRGAANLPAPSNASPDSRERAMTGSTPYVDNGLQHAALWLVGPDMPGLLNLGATFVAERGGNIDKDIADKFGENAVIFMSITASPADIARMNEDKMLLRDKSGCNVKFQPMSQPTVPPGYQELLHGMDIVTEDAVGLIAAMTKLFAEHGVFVVGHTGERRVVPGPRPRVEFGQKYVVMLPREFDRYEFTRQVNEQVKRHNGTIKTPLQAVPGLLWWWT